MEDAAPPLLPQPRDRQHRAWQAPRRSPCQPESEHPAVQLAAGLPMLGRPQAPALGPCRQLRLARGLVVPRPPALHRRCAASAAALPSVSRPPAWALWQYQLGPHGRLRPPAPRAGSRCGRRAGPPAEAQRLSPTCSPPGSASPCSPRGRPCGRSLRGGRYLRAPPPAHHPPPCRWGCTRQRPRRPWRDPRVGHMRPCPSAGQPRSSGLPLPGSSCPRPAAQWPSQQRERWWALWPCCTSQGRR
mmetsp:Transcript_8542/g.26570  ORF Transcript_8542/g.26570 Transcript_8542/m.26570 type:complete len:244 (-) Transcript_8542:365-1096(-)